MQDLLYVGLTIVVFAVLTLLLFYMHRANIARLQAGTEGRIGQK